MTDPRYDSQFRRGYHGPPISPPPARPGSTEPATAEPAPAGPAPAEPAEPATSGMLRDLDAVETGLPSALPLAVAPESHGAEEPPPSRRQNPFAIALVVAAAVMVLVGIWMIGDTSRLNSAGYSPDQQTAVLVEGQLAPVLLTGGVFAIVAWLVLGALAASARKRRD